MFGISGGELFVLLIIAALIMGPKNVAQALQGLRKLLEWVREWSAKLRTETAVDLSVLGIDASDVEKIKNFNLSQYDPRQMVREAVQEEMNAWIAATSGATKAGRETAAGAVAAMQQAVAPFPVDEASTVNESPLTNNRPAAGPESKTSHSTDVPPLPNYLGSIPHTESTASPGHDTERDGHPRHDGGADQSSGGNHGSASHAVSAPDFASQPRANLHATSGPATATKPNYLAISEEPRTESSSFQPHATSLREQPGQATTQGATSPSDSLIEGDGPLDLHTILNRPDLGGSR